MKKGSAIDTSSDTSSDTSTGKSDTSDDTYRGIITLLNYTRYSPLLDRSDTSSDSSTGKSDTLGGSVDVSIEKECIKKESEEVLCYPSDDPPISDNKSKKRTSPRSKSVPRQTKEDAEKAIYELDVDQLRSKYPSLDIEHQHLIFSDYYLGGNDPKTEKPNWMRWNDWNRAFHTWCRNATKWNGQREQSHQLQTEAAPVLAAHREADVSYND